MVFSGLKLWSRGVAVGLGLKGVLRLKYGLDVLFRCWESDENILKWFYFILYFLNLKFKSYFDQLKFFLIKLYLIIQQKYLINIFISYGITCVI